jgi:hypothetical protein
LLHICKNDLEKTKERKSSQIILYSEYLKYLIDLINDDLSNTKTYQNENVANGEVIQLTETQKNFTVVDRSTDLLYKFYFVDQ